MLQFNGFPCNLFKRFCCYPSVGGASFADIGEALDEISSLSINEVETKEPFSVQSHKDVVISCCWLHIKVRAFRV